jgi:hypothetical protein
VTALHGVGCSLLCEFGTVPCVTVGDATLGGVAAFCTLGGETLICTLGGASLLSISAWGGIESVLCVGNAPSNIAASRSSKSI